MDDLKEQLDEIRYAKESLELEFAALSAENEELKQQIQESLRNAAKEDMYTDMRDQFYQVKEDNSILTYQVNTLREEKTKNLAEISALNLQISELQRENEKLQLSENELNKKEGGE